MPEDITKILAHLRETSNDDDECTRRLTAISTFVAAIGRPAAQDYFRAIRQTGRVSELTDRRVLDFARTVDPHTAEWYFWACWGTGAVAELTDDRVLRAVEFFRSLDSPATVEFFLAIRETKEAKRLTDERVLAFARAIGSEAAVEYFGACWETGAVGDLTADHVLALAASLGGEAARELFRAVRETRAVAELTSERVLAFARAHGSRFAGEYFHAIRETKSADRLTAEAVLRFAESIGGSAARQYFRVLGSTHAVAELTGEGLLRSEGVIRSIGPDAALDYFLAAATDHGGRSPPPLDDGSRAGASPLTVPVLTLLDLPSYGRYRALGLVGVTAAFWAGAWGLAGPPVGSLPEAGLIALFAGAWVALLVGAHLLLGAIADRTSEEFLRRRRRLLNEHGIRWHDCLADGPGCELCWNADAVHADRRFDYGRWCRCPAC